MMVVVAMGEAYQRMGQAVSQVGNQMFQFAQKKQDIVNKGILSSEKVQRDAIAAQIVDYTEKNQANPEKWSEFANKTWAEFQKGVAVRAKKEGWGSDVVSQVQMDNKAYNEEAMIHLDVMQSKAEIAKADGRIFADTKNEMELGDYQAGFRLIDKSSLSSEQKIAKKQEMLNSALWSDTHAKFTAISNMPLESQRNAYAALEKSLNDPKAGKVKDVSSDMEFGLNQNTRVELYSIAVGHKQRAENKQLALMSHIHSMALSDPHGASALAQEELRNGNITVDNIADISRGYDIGMAKLEAKQEKATKQQANAIEADKAKVAALEEGKAKTELTQINTYTDLESRMNRGHDVSEEELNANLNANKLNAEQYTRLKNRSILRNQPEMNALIVKSSQSTDAKSVINNYDKFIQNFAAMSTKERGKVPYEIKIAFLSTLSSSLANRADIPDVESARLMQNFLDANLIDIRKATASEKDGRMLINGRQAEGVEVRTRSLLYESLSGASGENQKHIGKDFYGDLMLNNERLMEEFFTSKEYKDADPVNKSKMASKYLDSLNSMNNSAISGKIIKNGLFK
jgi:hypothetical protein